MELVRITNDLYVNPAHVMRVYRYGESRCWLHMVSGDRICVEMLLEDVCKRLYGDFEAGWG